MFGGIPGWGIIPRGGIPGPLGGPIIGGPIGGIPGLGGPIMWGGSGGIPGIPVGKNIFQVTKKKPEPVLTIKSDKTCPQQFISGI